MNVKQSRKMSRVLIALSLILLFNNVNAMGCPEKCTCQHNILKCIHQQLKFIPEVPAVSTQMWVCFLCIFIWKNSSLTSGVHWDFCAFYSELLCIKTPQKLRKQNYSKFQSREKSCNYYYLHAQVVFAFYVKQYSSTSMKPLESFYFF